MIRILRIRRLVTLVLSCMVASGAILIAAVVEPPQPSQAAGDMMIHEPDHPLLRGFRWRSIGPAGQGGRVDDLAVHPEDSRIFYVGFATGGLWKTTNRGTTFTSVFETHGTQSIGDLAIAPSNPDVLYVGTGEANNRQSSSFGGGVYRSTDGGETFEFAGLRDTQSIARIRVHPTSPDVAWVAAVGHLFGPNPERGIFKTTDGGQTWRQVLFVDDDTGATDLVLDPADPDVLLAATYAIRTRKRSISRRRVCRSRNSPTNPIVTVSTTPVRNQVVAHQNGCTHTATLAPAVFQIPSLLQAMT
jgi:photosystem II stability/assembly factor-like uncharacterized protein